MTDDHSKPSSTELAEGRTELAADRTMLANERTLAAWWRTTMAAMAAAVAFAKLFGDVEPRWLVRGGATLMVTLAVIIIAVSLLRYRRTARRIDCDHVDSVSTFTLSAATLLLGLAALVAGVAVWLV